MISHFFGGFSHLNKIGFFREQLLSLITLNKLKFKNISKKQMHIRFVFSLKFFFFPSPKPLRGKKCEITFPCYPAPHSHTSSQLANTLPPPIEGVG